MLFYKTGKEQAGRGVKEQVTSMYDLVKWLLDKALPSLSHTHQCHTDTS